MTIKPYLFEIDFKNDKLHGPTNIITYLNPND